MEDTIKQLKDLIIKSPVPIPFLAKNARKPGAKKVGVPIQRVIIPNIAVSADTRCAEFSRLEKDQQEDVQNHTILSIDYGPRKAGFAIGTQCAPKSPMIMDFISNANLFPVNMPTVQSLSEYFNMPLIYQPTSRNYSRSASSFGSYADFNTLLGAVIAQLQRAIISIDEMTPDQVVHLLQITIATVQKVQGMHSTETISDTSVVAPGGNDTDNLTKSSKPLLGEMIVSDYQSNADFEERSSTFDKLYPLVRSTILKRSHWKTRMFNVILKENVGAAHDKVELAVSNMEIPEEYSLNFMLQSNRREFENFEMASEMAGLIEMWILAQGGLNVNQQRKMAILGGSFGLDAQTILLDDKDNYGKIPNSPEGAMHGYYEVLSIYYEFWQRAIGPIDAVVIESQPMSLTPSGVIGQCMMGMFYMAHCKNVTFLNANHKLHVFPLDETNIHNLIEERLWKENRWLQFGPSGRIQIKKISIPIGKIAKCIPEFCYHRKDRAHHNLLSPEELKQYLEDNPESPLNKPIIVDHSTLDARFAIAHRCDNTSSSSMNITHPQQYATAPVIKQQTTTIVLIDDDDKDGAVVKSTKKRGRPSKGVPSASDGAEEKSKQGGVVIKRRRKSKKDDALAEDSSDVANNNGNGKPKKKKKNFGGRVNPFAHAKMSKEEARSRVENKIEAVRRVKLIFNRRENLDVIGEKWKRLFLVLWNEDMQRDGADAVLMLFVAMAMHWNRELQENPEWQIIDEV